MSLYSRAFWARNYRTGYSEAMVLPWAEARY